MPNDRNAGRKPKYGSDRELKVLQRKIPKDIYSTIAMDVDALLKKYQITPEQKQGIKSQPTELDGYAKRKLNDNKDKL